MATDTGNLFIIHKLNKKERKKKNAISTEKITSSSTIAERLHKESAILRGGSLRR